MAFSTEYIVLINVLWYGARFMRFGEAAGACVSQPNSWHRSAEVTPNRWVGTFPSGVHRWSDQAVASMSSSLYLSTWKTLWTLT